VSVGDLERSWVSTATASYKGHRYPVEIINHCVWLYFRFSLSFREVEELMLARGVVVSYETIRRWCAKFGRPTPTSYVAAAHAPATSGTLTRCFFIFFNESPPRGKGPFFFWGPATCALARDLEQRPTRSLATSASSRPRSACVQAVADFSPTAPSTAPPDARRPAAPPTPPGMHAEPPVARAPSEGLPSVSTDAISGRR